MAMVCAAAQAGPPSLPPANPALKTPCSSGLIAGQLAAGPLAGNQVAISSRPSKAGVPLSRGAFLFYWRTPDIRIMGAGVGIGAKAGLPGRGAAGPVLLHVG